MGERCERIERKKGEVGRGVGVGERLTGGERDREGSFEEISVYRY